VLKRPGEIEEQNHFTGQAIHLRRITPFFTPAEPGQHKILVNPVNPVQYA
jgi:hypothetical protein